MFPSNQRGKETKEEKSSIVLYFSSIGVWFHKTVHVIIQFDKLIGEEFEFNIFKDIVCKRQKI